MKTLLALTSLIFFSSGVFANDFRSRNFGDSCEGIQQDELALSSTLDESNTSDRSYGFDTVFLDRMVKVGYFCDDTNKFVKGLYWFKFTSKSEQEDFLEVTLPRLKIEYGEPESDSFVRVDEEAEDIYFDLFWKQGRTRIHASLTGNFDEPTPEKLLTLWFQPIE